MFNSLAQCFKNKHSILWKLLHILLNNVLNFINKTLIFRNKFIFVPYFKTSLVEHCVDKYYSRSKCDMSHNPLFISVPRYSKCFFYWSLSGNFASASCSFFIDWILLLLLWIWTFKQITHSLRLKIVSVSTIVLPLI